MSEGWIDQWKPRRSRCQHGIISKIIQAFNLSSSLEIDELESDKLFQMNQVEFYEAVARISEKLSP